MMGNVEDATTRAFKLLRRQKDCDKKKIAFAVRCVEDMLRICSMLQGDAATAGAKKRRNYNMRVIHLREGAPLLYVRVKEAIGI